MSSAVRKKQSQETSDNTQAHKAMTPMMVQYTTIKASHSDCLLFYRMGDFYELFFEDAELAAQALGIQLTKRGKHQGADIPMCGVPVHSADEYLHQLIRKGFRVAVCEQTEDPAEAKKRGAKSVVNRDVVRIVTPGTLTEDNLLSVGQNNFLTAIFKNPKGDLFSFASIDISTGEFLISEVSITDLPGEVVRLSPSEVLVSDGIIRDEEMILLAETTTLTPLPNAYYDSQAGIRDLKTLLNVSVLDGVGTFSRGEMAAVGALLKYIELTQLGKQPAIRMPKRQGNNSVLVIDAATRVNLELVKSMQGERKGSLLDAVDRTVTGAGARELATRLASPLGECARISERQDVVACFLKQGGLRSQLRKTLRKATDPARAFSRLALGRGGPRDMGALRDSLKLASELYEMMVSAKSLAGEPVLLSHILSSLKGANCALAEHLDKALGEDLPFLKRDGGFVRTGYREDLDEVRKLRDESRQVLAALQARYVEETQVKSLKIRHNNVLGYFVDVTASHGKTLMEGALSEVFIHRQTLANAVRFTTVELNDIQTKIHSAAERSLAIEQEVFDVLQAEIIANEEMLIALADGLAQLDVYLALAELAEEQNYVRPTVDESFCFEITGGRHPVVDIALKAQGQGPFIENDCILTSDKQQDTEIGKLWILTGPNMAGKSTFLRQNALITILAQMGSFVPAQSAHIGLVDRLFSRVGASDDLARGRSTFMVEMVETAAILNQATERSFVILDEIGRGTATFDGLSIAWATVEYLHEQIKSRSLFATHYHELTALSEKLGEVINMTIQVKEWKDDIVFLHKVIPGAADRSYGVQVAKLAGLPAPVIGRASEVLDILENSDAKTGGQDLIEELPLFAASRPKVSEGGAEGFAEEDSAVRLLLDQTNPDELTPKSALDLVYQLKSLNS
ncbi:MAG: DNA mismatch repair protein MutS [Methyloligellaceae bacterium]